MKKSRIVLMGFSGCGKSTIGKKLAKKLNYEFIDLDKLMEKTYKLSIADFFEKYGENIFRQCEYSLLKTVLEKENTVIATGGGTPCFYNSIELIVENSISVYIHLSGKSLQSRLLASKTVRPLLKDKTPDDLLQYIDRTLETREEFYNRATITLKGENFSIETLTGLIQNPG